jgi:hypothetical protein
VHPVEPDGENYITAVVDEERGIVLPADGQQAAAKGGHDASRQLLFADLDRGAPRRQRRKRLTDAALESRAVSPAIRDEQEPKARGRALRR